MKTMTLGEYLEQNESVVVFAVDVGRPGGYHYPAGCEGWDIPDQHLALEGTVDEDNRWSWDNEVAVRDDHGNSITRITAYVAPQHWTEMVTDYESI